MSPRQLAFLLIPTALFAQEPPRNVSGGPLIPEQACFDVRHCDLTLRVDPAAQSIDGELRMRALATADCARIALDLDAPLAVHSITVDGTPAGFDRGEGRLWIEPTPAPTVGHEFTVAVAYGGKPRVSPKPPWVGGFTWAKTRDGKPWIATSCQGEGADLWWPCKDHPSDKPDTFDLFITVPEGLVVASNGTLQGEPATVDGATTFHWHVASPISNYCIALNIAPYVCIRDTYTSVDGTRVPVEFYALPQNEQKARHILPQFLDHLRFFEETLGPYPFRAEKYGVAETPHLGMEHQSIIAYGNRYLDMRYDWLHNHELSHEWFGNLITCRDWKDMWLHESFGTYMQPLYLEKRFGRAAYDLEMKKDARCDNLAPVAPRTTCDSQQIYFDHGSNDIYYKGAWVLHTLRWELGDEQFFTCLRRFCYPTEAAAKATDGSQVRFVDTDDFVRLCSEIAGRDMAWFFEVYVRRAELPRLEVTAANGGLDLAWVTPDRLPFELAVPVEIGEHIERVAMPAGHGHVDLHGHDYEVDPEHRLLMATK